MEFPSGRGSIKTVLIVVQQYGWSDREGVG